MVRIFIYYINYIKRFICTLWPHSSSGYHNFNQLASTLYYDTSKKVLNFVANCAKIFFFMSALFKFLNYLSLFNACNMAFQKKRNFFYQGILCANVNFMSSLFLFSFSLCYYKITLLDFIMQSRSVLQFSTLYIVCTNSWSNKISLITNGIFLYHIHSHEHLSLRSYLSIFTPDLTNLEPPSTIFRN